MHYSTIYISHPSVRTTTDHRMLAVLSELGFTLGTLSQQSRNGYFCVDNNFSSIIVIIFHGDYRRRRRGVAVVPARKSHPRNPFSDFGLGGVESERKKRFAEALDHRRLFHLVLLSDLHQPVISTPAWGHWRCLVRHRDGYLSVISFHIKIVVWYDL